MIQKYLHNIQGILDLVLDTQLGVMEEAAQVIAKALQAERKLYVFGCNHAGILAQELFYRSGGLVPVHPIFAPGLHLDAIPISLTTDVERLEGYGRRIMEQHRLAQDDVLIIHSVSGRNAVSIDAALCARERGTFVIGLTNLNTSQHVESRHSSGKNLFEVCDLVIDNCGAHGDAAMEMEDFPQKFAPTSTSVGSAILNAVIAEVVSIYVQDGKTPPVFISSNVAGGDEHNAQLMEVYRNKIPYL